MEQQAANALAQQQLALKDKRRRKTIRFLFILSMTIIPILHYAVFYVYVNLDSFLIAFRVPQNGELVFSFDNFVWAFNNIFHGQYSSPTDNLGLSFINTFKSFLINICMFPVGLLVSYFIYKKIFGYKAFRLIFYLPGLISGVVVSFFYRELMGAASPIPALLGKLYHLDYELASPLTDSFFANRMVFLHMIWLGFPGSLIIWGGTYARIPDSVIESGRLDGANWLVEYFRIIIPMVWPTLVLMITTSLSGIFSAGGAVFLLTGGDYGTQTVSNWIYMNILRANGTMSPYLYRTAALGLMLSVVSIIIAFSVRKIMNNTNKDVDY